MEDYLERSIMLVTRCSLLQSFNLLEHVGQTLGNFSAGPCFVRIVWARLFPEHRDSNFDLDRITVSEGTSARFVLEYLLGDPYHTFF